mmetsp:Transcript_8134/g.14446  ORF Transcript_8134/g.14446 Transcript_8134/m.14446 type:complete len:447 (-) Transcript_8134:912-2252(-)
MSPRRTCRWWWAPIASVGGGRIPIGMGGIPIPDGTGRGPIPLPRVILATCLGLSQGLCPPGAQPFDIRCERLLQLPPVVRWVDHLHVLQAAKRPLPIVRCDVHPLHDLRHGLPWHLGLQSCKLMHQLPGAGVTAQSLVQGEDEGRRRISTIWYNPPKDLEHLVPLVVAIKLIKTKIEGRSVGTNRLGVQGLGKGIHIPESHNISGSRRSNLLADLEGVRHDLHEPLPHFHTLLVHGQGHVGCRGHTIEQGGEGHCQPLLHILSLLVRSTSGRCLQHPRALLPALLRLWVLGPGVWDEILWTRVPTSQRRVEHEDHVLQTTLPEEGHAAVRVRATQDLFEFTAHLLPGHPGHEVLPHPLLPGSGDDVWVQREVEAAGKSDGAQGTCGCHRVRIERPQRGHGGPNPAEAQILQSLSCPIFHFLGAEVVEEAVDGEVPSPGILLRRGLC